MEHGIYNRLLCFKAIWLLDPSISDSEFKILHLEG